ncbi:MAG: efflux RND transporter permease subunit [Gammaproteobacteria bacterium]|nr:efflux RND transporter permease subunit [Gammaproteobacteria bacterium]
MIEFFIRRPIFAMVISILMVFIGLLSLLSLPIAQLPDIVPPQIQVSTQFLGADSQTVSDSVTTPIEKAINGVNGITYINSSSSNLGYASINVNFMPGHDINVASSDVFANVSNTTAKLPTFVNQAGINVKKVSKNMVLVVNLVSKNKLYDSKFLSNYAEINIVPVLKRIYGVGDVTNYGLLQYAIRIWLDPNKMASLGLMPQDVIDAVKDQNQQAALGILSQPPLATGASFQIQLVSKGLLQKPEEYENIIVKTGDNGRLVKIKDLGRVELGAQNYDSASFFNQGPTATVAIMQYPGSNAVSIANQVHNAMQNLHTQFPPGIDYEIVYDTTLFVKESLKEVGVTLFEAMLLVFLVVYAFLQNIRSTLIPCIAIPVSLIGTFTFFKIFGFSINTLSLLGLVLAIGLVVDDAIVVVENVERKLEEGMTDVKEATRLATEEVKSPIIATTLILLAVFVPVAFIPGITGMLYKQFALAIAFSVGLSGINSLTLSPALCGLLLRAKHQQIKEKSWQYYFEHYFKKMISYYRLKLEWVILHRGKIFIGFLGLIVLMALLLSQIPKAFLPEEDQGYLIVVIKKPEGHNIYSMEKTFADIEPIIKNMEGVSDMVEIAGINILDQINQPSAGVIFTVLKPWHERTSTSLQSKNIANRLQKKLSHIPGAQILVIKPPSIPGLSTIGGFQFTIQDKNFEGVKTLHQAVNRFVMTANQTPGIDYLMSNLTFETPGFYLDIDREKAKSLKLGMTQINQTIQSYFGAYFINNFTRYGQVLRVIAQADGSKRLNQAQLEQIYVRNADGKMVPFSAFMHVNYQNTAFNIPHYNLYTSAVISGAFSPSISTGQGIKIIDKLCERVLPQGMMKEWIGITDAQIKAGNIASMVFMLCLIFVFLFLAALYESWTMPFMILLVVPLALLGAAFGLWIRHLPLDVFGQIGLILLIGLAAKNAILIVEFAKEDQVKNGSSVIDAIIKAALLRLRPILMTAFAFIFGVLPLAIASGAGAMSRQSIGTTVLFGMLVATFLTLFMIPIFYFYIESWRERKGYAQKH